MLGYAFDDEPARLWLPHLGPMPEELRQAIESPGVMLKAWNAQFERVILRDVLGIHTDYTRWRCSMVRAGLLSLPMKLEDCGKVMRLGDKWQKSSEGKRLINVFCKPHKPTKKHPGDGLSEHVWYTRHTHPAEWKTFCNYCLQDVVSERHIDKVLSRFPIPEREWTIYALDQKVNDAGIPIDLAFVRNAISIFKRRKGELKIEMTKLTGLANPNSNEQLLPWLRKRGYPFDNLQKEWVAKAVEDFKDTVTPECLAVLKLRKIAAKTSVTKFQAILRRCGPDGRIRYMFKQAGAGRTGRWASTGINFQNLARPPKDLEKFLADIREFVLKNDYDSIKLFFGDPILVLSSSVRSAIAAPPGRKLAIADLSAIETRMVGYGSNCPGLNEIFAKGLCPYKTFGCKLFDKAYDDITGEERGLSKPGVLGGFFQLGGGGEMGEYPNTIKTGLWGYAEKYYVKLTKAEAHHHIKILRATYVEVPEMWAEMSGAMIRAVDEPGKHTAGVVEFDRMPPFVRMRIPSGRHLYYLRPKVSMHTIKHADGEFRKRGVSYEGRSKTGRWTRVTTMGGKNMENFCQATAREVLCDGLLEADRLGYMIVGHVHDEIICEQLADDTVHDVKNLCAAMSIVPAWAPGLLLGAAGYEASFYRKD